MRGHKEQKVLRTWKTKFFRAFQHKQYGLARVLLASFLGLFVVTLAIALLFSSYTGRNYLRYSSVSAFLPNQDASSEVAESKEFWDSHPVITPDAPGGISTGSGTVIPINIQYCISGDLDSCAMLCKDDVLQKEVRDLACENEAKLRIENNPLAKTDPSKFRTEVCSKEGAQICARLDKVMSKESKNQCADGKEVEVWNILEKVNLIPTGRACVYDSNTGVTTDVAAATKDVVSASTGLVDFCNQYPNNPSCSLSQVTPRAGSSNTPSSDRGLTVQTQQQPSDTKPSELPPVEEKSIFDKLMGSAKDATAQVISVTKVAASAVANTVTNLFKDNKPEPIPTTIPKTDPAPPKVSDEQRAEELLIQCRNANDTAACTRLCGDFPSSTACQSLTNEDDNLYQKCLDKSASDCQFYCNRYPNAKICFDFDYKEGIFSLPTQKIDLKNLPNISPGDERPTNLGPIPTGACQGNWLAKAACNISNGVSKIVNQAGEVYDSTKQNIQSSIDPKSDLKKDCENKFSNTGGVKYCTNITGTDNYYDIVNFIEQRNSCAASNWDTSKSSDCKDLFTPCETKFGSGLCDADIQASDKANFNATLGRLLERDLGQANAIISAQLKDASGKPTGQTVYFPKK